LSDTTDLLIGADTASGVDAATKPRRRAGGGLATLLLPELQRLAVELGIIGASRMRKGELIAAIHATQSPGRPEQAEFPVIEAPVAVRTPVVEAPAAATPVIAASVEPTVATSIEASGTGVGERPRRGRRGASRPVGSPDGSTEITTVGDGHSEVSGAKPRSELAEGTERVRDRAQGDSAESGQTDRSRDRGPRTRGQNDRDRPQGDRNSQGDRSGRSQNDRTGSQNDRTGQSDRNNQYDRNQNDRNQNDRDPSDRDDDSESGRRRRGRFRDRNRRSGRPERSERFSGDSEPVVGEDDVLIPVAGIVDILDNYAFVRTSGYLTGPNDVYVSLSQVRRYGLRRGDAVTGAVRQPREGERKDKFNALVRLDTINGAEADKAKERPEFHKLTPLYPQDRLRLETEPQILTTRVIDLVMPIGKGQRALIVSPPKAGKTMVLQSIANAITTNNPECHLMVVLVDERPEEVTDMQRSVKGEVIASTFDRPPADHTTVAELSIERAKRLVELGHDVVVLLDSITRLGRAYNLAAPASGRILSGGVDSTALYPPKRFLGAARNIEDGGSLTILATALVETGSTMDTVIFEEFKGTGNAELKLDRKIADKRVFPAVDVDASGTRKEELLLATDEMAIVHKLRRVLHALDSQQALDLLLDQLRKTRTNVEFLMQIQKTTPGGGGSLNGE
jgi:transcription termination factor Rho